MLLFLLTMLYGEMTVSQQELDIHYMQMALALAEQAELHGEVPVGAVLVQGDKVVSRGFNLNILNHDASAHAEMECIRAAGKALDNYRLLDTTLYVTLEPCAMCAGAMVHARISRLVFGAADLKTGAAGSVLNLVNNEAFNHQLSVTSGVLAQECSEQLSAFFRRRRKEKKALKMAEKQKGLNE
ncbi:tRNA adenosine(34) deaminase TadA [Shewanella colwelliana]|uniref:tRNA adenosine(34) deaminase TadA n=1 Tax=Shewanella colwelliana TaxID=23 RepID=UPI0022B00C8E|nr:tRNA adenosine(34) deaminase TadA [Shewanella colwelliana]MCZ4338821.1 tRNA adenosine(34) deaminase TadA [Shewanella colwelliana]